MRRGPPTQPRGKRRELRFFGMGSTNRLERDMLAEASFTIETLIWHVETHCKGVKSWRIPVRCLVPFVRPKVHPSIHPGTKIISLSSFPLPSTCNRHLKWTSAWAAPRKKRRGKRLQKMKLQTVFAKNKIPFSLPPPVSLSLVAPKKKAIWQARAFPYLRGSLFFAFSPPIRSRRRFQFPMK